MNMQHSCLDDSDPLSLSPQQAHTRIRDTLPAPTGRETLGLRDALGRVLAEDIIANIDVPGADNSAMDGYALRGTDLPMHGEGTFHLVGSSFAGHPYPGMVEAGQCVRIMTGGLVPDGCDTVVIQERVQVLDEQRVAIPPGEKAGGNVRTAGEDIAAGSILLQRGRLLNAADLGLLASVGMSTTCVFPIPRVAFFSTGDELRSVGESLEPGCIYNSNSYTIFAMLRRLGIEGKDLGIIPDNRASVREAFRNAASQADVVITSGGVSVGEADYVKEVLEEIGDVRFWKIAIKPGRPLAFGHVDPAVFFGLPGNPVSVMVTFYQFVLPALQFMAGQRETTSLQLRLPTSSPLRKRPGRVEYQRGTLEAAKDGSLSVRSTGGQGSGILTSMSRADCFIVLPMECARVEAGEMVTVVPFAGLM